MFVPTKNQTKKKKISADAGYFLSPEIDSGDFNNENLTPKITINKEEKQYFLKNFFQKFLKQAKP